MSRSLFALAFVLVTLVVVGPVIGAAPDDGAAATQQAFAQKVQPLFEKYCYDCHSGEKPEGMMRLDVFRSADTVVKAHKSWERILHMMRGREMPPEDAERPPEEDLNVAVAWIDAKLNEVDCTGPVDPGRVTIRRLNRVEYGNTIRDLLGIEFQAAAEFPADDVGYGFDNIGDVLSLPPMLMEKYLAAAEDISRRAIVTASDDYPESHRRIFLVQPSDQVTPDAASRQILERLASRAFRRPVREQELARLFRLASQVRQQSESFETSIQYALQAILISPHFLFRIEQDPEPNTRDNVRELDEYELATRLSYFLWSSMPDEELFGTASRGELRKNLDSQVARMLADPKSIALVENFALQWLQLRNLADFVPDRGLFPTFNDELRAAMLAETRAFCEHVMRDDRSVIELIDADYTFVNEQLAKHYGISGVTGTDFRRVSLAGTPRGGVITQASVLAVTSNPTRTSAVKRGKWILENILGTPPPEPPANVPQLSEDRRAALTASLRERLEEHRRNPNCAVCHRKMDAMGFAMENFDTVGAWRTHDGKFKIDSSGELPDGRSFDGPEALKDVLKSDPYKDEFAKCLTEKTLTYALGRGLERYDKCAVDKITKSLSENDYRFSTLVLQVIRSDPFQKRRGKEKEG